MKYISFLQSVVAPTSARYRRFSRASFCFGAAALLVAMMGCQEDVTSPTPPEPELALATAAVPLAFYQVSAGAGYTCGVTTDNRAYCWGTGLLGDGSTWNPGTRPVAVAGGLRFHAVSVGNTHACGITTDNRAYCWGENSGGQLGNGTTTNRLRPVLVAGGRRFSQVDAGSSHSCGLSYPDKRAYCWGTNTDGALGNGTVTRRLTPVAVVGARQFRQVSAGWNHTCAVTPTDVAYCWGTNRSGEAGDGSTFNQRLRPVLVAGGLKFRQVDAAYRFTCGVTTSYRAFCWGDGRSGQMGNGKNDVYRKPTAVAGGLRFDRVSAGSAHACGETTNNRAYCWGSNTRGGVGDGSRLNQRLTPVAVVGGLFFSQVSAGSFYTCGRTAEGKAYCWGDNLSGELGDGTTTERSTPTAVAGPM